MNTKEKMYWERIKSEQRCMSPIKNEDLVCKDCRMQLDDTTNFRNTCQCDFYSKKPSDIIYGGLCDVYERNDF